MSERKLKLPKIKPSKSVLVAILILLLLAATSGGWYLYYTQTKTLDAIRKDPAKIQELTENEVSGLIAKVRSLIELPEDEQPTVATVTNAEALKESEPFFSKAQNGDKVLIFSTSKKAILYRPSSNKIIEVAPLNIDVTQGEQNLENLEQPTPSISPTPTPVATTSATPSPTL